MRVGVSVSDSDDLERLGLSKAHVDFAVAELARAVLIAGGTLVYGGRVKPPGYTQLLLHEVNRYGRRNDVLTLCLAAPEHRKLSVEEMGFFDRQLGTRVRLICLDEDGCPMDALTSKAHERAIVGEANGPHAYSALRHYMVRVTDARVLVGGSLSTFAGAMPGVIEETINSISSGQPLIVSAGFGGAAALVARQLGIDELVWAPSDFPQRPDDTRIDEAVIKLEEAIAETSWSPRQTGLTSDELSRLSATHRASEVASLAVRGLSRVLG